MYPLKGKKSAGFKKSGEIYSNEEDIIGFYDCPNGLSYNLSTAICDISVNNDNCPGYYMTSSGQTYSACSEDANEGGFVTLDSVLDCLGRTFLGISVSDAIFGSADRIVLSGKILAKTALKMTFKALIRVAGLAGALIAITEFGDCMGFYDIPYF